MNDANGLVYKDGEYHLYFQHNPYGSMGEYALVTFREQRFGSLGRPDSAIARDTLGHIFREVLLWDKHNSAGYGENTIIAFILRPP